MSKKKYIGIAAASLLTADLLTSYTLYSIATARKPIKTLKNNHSTDKEKEVNKMRSEGIRWINSMNPEHIETVSNDGTKLSGRLILNSKPKCTVILCHGYRAAEYNDFSGIAKHLYDIGCNLLFITERAHRESGGNHITYGAKERFDVLAWIDYAEKKFGESEKLFLYGISMGAAAVMMASQLIDKQNIKGIIADCGFTTPREIFAHVVKQMHIPLFPVLNTCNLMCEVFSGFGFDDCSSPQSLANSEIPILLIHGTADNFVPPYMSEENFLAARGQKKLVLIDGAEHARSCFTDFAKYTTETDAFIEKNL